MSGFLSAVIQSNNEFEFKRLYDKYQHDEGYLNAVNQFGESPIMLAARLGRAEMVKMLALNPLVDVNFVNINNGRTPLSVAIEKNQELVIDVLLDPQIEFKRVAMLKLDSARQSSVVESGLFAVGNHVDDSDSHACVLKYLKSPIINH